MRDEADARICYHNDPAGAPSRMRIESECGLGNKVKEGSIGASMECSVVAVKQLAWSAVLWQRRSDVLAAAPDER